MHEQLSDFELMLRIADVDGIHQCLPQLIDAVCDKHPIDHEIEATFRRLIGVSDPLESTHSQQVGNVSFGGTSFSFV